MASPSPRFLSVLDVITLHQAIMERTGFTPAPLRDEAALQSAVMRPQMAAHYEQGDLVRQAALLAVGISQAQAFLDGNKRTAYVSLEVFLDLNGLQYVAEPLDLAHQLEAVAERTDPLAVATDRFEAWLRSRVKPYESYPDGSSTR